MTTLRRGWMAAAIAMGLIALLSACGGDDSSSDAGATPSGDAFDRAFIDAMVPHHESAIEMATAAKEAGLSQPELVEVADDILAMQQLEINQMKDWRGEWFGSSTIDPDGGEALGLSRSQMGMDMEHDVGMLENSTNIDTDFAQMMITHHQGAITMAKLAADNAEHGELKDLAEEIISAQEREIGVMRPHASGTMNHG
ncbi:MAG: DUF305 domain-containing protein [Gaiellaceae bacterium MAG52_C11]|nr:DUF305 domain-containing protein [Candidatus Gaiellasilicea maunaloa]